jgi:hypothetical protein
LVDVQQVLRSLTTFIKDMEVIGIDVSKRILDAWSESMGHMCFKNSPTGHKKLL